MKTYLVGGAVRDKLLGLEIKDHDWLVINSKPSCMIKLGFIKVGKQFPIFLHPETHEEYALARTEKKTGLGYQAFEVNTDNVSLIEDLKRRDLTINAMAIDENSTLHDPFHGQEDIKNKKLRHVSDAFCEDPLRVLRVARFDAKLHFLGFTIADETCLLIKRQIISNNELEALSSEHILQEINRALSTQNPEIFILTLQKLGAFQHILKPLYTLTLTKLKPLIQAIKMQCTDIGILLSLMLINLDTEQQLLEILDELKPPKITQLLCLKLYRHHFFFSQIYKHPKENILQSLKTIDALRNKSAFKRFLVTLRYIYHDTPHLLFNLHLTKEIQKSLTQHDYCLALKDICNKQIIAKTVTKLQLKLITETVDRILQNKT